MNLYARLHTKCGFCPTSNRHATTATVGSARSYQKRPTAQCVKPRFAKLRGIGTKLALVRNWFCVTQAPDRRVGDWAAVIRQCPFNGKVSAMIFDRVTRRRVLQGTAGAALAGILP